MSGLGLFVILLAAAMMWAGWHNYAIWDVIGKVIGGQPIDPGQPGHMGGDGVKHLVSFDWSKIPGGSAIKTVTGDVSKVTGGAVGAGAAVASGGAITPAPVQNWINNLMRSVGLP